MNLIRYPKDDRLNDLTQKHRDLLEELAAVENEHYGKATRVEFGFRDFNSDGFVGIILRYRDDYSLQIPFPGYLLKEREQKTEWWQEIGPDVLDKLKEQIKTAGHERLPDTERGER